MLQQKTLRDIRTAIRPQLITTQDQLYLPPQFDNPTIQVIGGEESDVVVNVKQGGGLDHVDTNKVKKAKGTESSWKQDTKQGSEEGSEGQVPVMPAADTQPVQESFVKLPPNSDPAHPSKDKSEEKPLSRAERRKKIKEEILAIGEGDGFKGYRRRAW